MSGGFVGIKIKKVKQEVCESLMRKFKGNIPDVNKWDNLLTVRDWQLWVRKEQKTSSSGKHFVNFKLVCNGEKQSKANYRFDYVIENGYYYNQKDLKILQDHAPKLYQQVMEKVKEYING